MNKLKVQETITDLKKFFQKKELTISEVREAAYRLIDYIDVTYDEDSRDVPFKSNGIGIKNGGLIQAIKR
jgi:hypothetical protein